MDKVQNIGGGGGGGEQGGGGDKLFEVCKLIGVPVPISAK